jgi:hypothetical protein
MLEWKESVNHVLASDYDFFAHVFSVGLEDKDSCSASMTFARPGMQIFALISFSSRPI